MYTIKFGTDGWREIIADNFTTANVRRVAQATGTWLKETQAEPSVVVGYDCRFGGLMFARETAGILAAMGIKVHLSTGFVSTPMVSLGARNLGCTAGIILTASHNPPSYNGYKIKAGYGGPASPAVIEAVESHIPATEVAPALPLQHWLDAGMVEYCDLENMYLDHVRNSFDMAALEKASESLVYDAMYGAGQNVIRRLFPKATLMHAEYNPGFMDRAPEPILKNLPEIAAMIQESDRYLCGLATDGDADRIGFFDEQGRFIDSHHLIMLLMEYLTTHKGMSGKIVKSFSVSDKVSDLSRHKGLETITTKIGFKYICEYMVTDDVLIGAEESGGIAIKGHIPERDGIWMGLVLMEYMAKTGKKISELISDLYSVTGSFAVERYDLHLEQAQKEKIVGACKQGAYTSFGSYSVQRVEDLDGYKFHLPGGEWVMIRPSGTEPVLRVYAEARDSATSFAILEAVKAHILS
ncbi:MAG: phosphoglucomutase/phosphomannomutase family protein [Bacteroidetes bacterium]|nr:phosphoglucomutase/phosphomannomutase family protein [Bacteroidota bacterium]